MTAVVTLLVNDPVTGEQRNTTVAVLGKGSSFGVSQYFVSSENVQIRMQQFQYCANIISVLHWLHIQYRLSIFPSYRNWPCFIIRLAVRQSYAKMKFHFWQFAERFVVWQYLTYMFPLQNERLHLSKSWYPLLQDFRDIFMSYEDGREPDHIRFLK